MSEDPIARGYATKLGELTAAVLALVAAVTAVLDGDHSTETIAALAGAVLTVITILAGRYLQNAARLRAGVR